MSILTLNQVSLILGGHLLLDNVDWSVQAQDKIALVGRNGAGKSSLLQLLQKHIYADSGKIQYVNGLRLAGLNQEVPADSDQWVYSFLVQGLKESGAVLCSYYQLLLHGSSEELGVCHQKMDELNAWEILPRVEMFISRLGLDPTALMKNLSGGMKRRVLLAAALITAPDLLLLDEPTNHLDLPTIEWLEGYLKSYPGSLIVVTHDRHFLNAVANRIVEIDRGKLISYPGDFESYLNYREAAKETEATHNALFDKHLAAEEAWIRTGVKARRTRNEGRVRALKALRQEHKERRAQLGKMKGLPIQVNRSGKIVLDAEAIQFSYQDNCLIKDFSLLLTRGDKLGIIGPNGCGKTSLIRLLLGELPVDKGTIVRGTSLEIAYFDQLRAELRDNETLMNNVADGADYVTINGQDKHVASYLREFLFTPERFNQPVSVLSGGERNRLLLAKLLAKPANLLVMDEPTNDLDMETLELLENKLVEYPGTLIIISHDRAFLNQVVTSVLVWEEGVFVEYSGDYEDYLRQRKAPIITPPVLKTPINPKPFAKLNYRDQKELAKLPLMIEKLEKFILEKQLHMADPTFYQQDPMAIGKLSKELLIEEKKLAELYERWQFLESQGDD